MVVFIFSFGDSAGKGNVTLRTTRLHIVVIGEMADQWISRHVDLAKHRIKMVRPSLDRVCATGKVNTNTGGRFNEQDSLGC